MPSRAFTVMFLFTGNRSCVGEVCVQFSLFIYFETATLLALVCHEFYTNTHTHTHTLVLHTNELVEFDIYSMRGIRIHTYNVHTHLCVMFFHPVRVSYILILLELFYLPFISVRFICFVNYCRRCCCRRCCYNCCFDRFVFKIFVLCFFFILNLNFMNDNLWTHYASIVNTPRAWRLTSVSLFFGVSFVVFCYWENGFICTHSSTGMMRTCCSYFLNHKMI